MSEAQQATPEVTIKKAIKNKAGEKTPEATTKKDAIKDLVETLEAARDAAIKYMPGTPFCWALFKLGLPANVFHKSNRRNA
jgi:hypothetical protein